MSETGIIKRVWSDEVRRQAYELWAGPAQQNVSEVARQLTAIVGEPVAHTTVRGWLDGERWRDRHAVDQVADTRQTMDQFVAVLWVAAIPALRTIDSLASGTLSGEPVDLDRRLRAAQFIVDKAQQLLLKQADSSRRQGTGSRAAATVDLKSMTAEQLRTYEAELNRDR
jgi:hypothetical protein